MLVDRRVPLPVAARRILSQDFAGGDLGFIGVGTSIVLGAGALVSALLGGGWLWTKHEEHELDEKYYDWLEIYQSDPYNLSPEDAAAFAKGELPPVGFDFGLNAKTAVLIMGGLAVFYVGSKVLVNWLSPGKK